MDWDRCREIDKDVHDANWLAYARSLYDEQLPAWLSKRHPSKYQCELRGAFYENLLRGSFNWVFKADFPDGESWAVRFARASTPFADAKTEAEVAAIILVQKQTDIPIPRVIDWGLTSDNELGLGPFIISEFVQGVQLADQLANPKERIFKDDIDDDFLGDVFEQIARFTLQLSKIEFSVIGALSVSAGENELPDVTGPPTCLKAQDLMQLGGIDCISTHPETFSSSVQYFEHLGNADIVQLREQLNSVDDEDDAKSKYICWHSIKHLIPRFSHDTYRNGPFKLICDDFGPFNMLLRSKDDPTIIAVLDWEFSYAGPVELFWAPPRWLIGERPKAWDDSSRTGRYLRHLDRYIQEIEKNEDEILGDFKDSTSRPSTLLRRAAEDGSMWFFHILRESFNGPDSQPFENLRCAVSDFEGYANVTSDAAQDFVELKKKHLAEYKVLVAEKEQWFEDWKT